MNTSHSLPDEFRVKVVPRAARSEIVGWTDGVLRVRIHAPPVEGRANLALFDLLSEYTGLPVSSFSVVQGARARIKRIRLKKI